MFASLCFAMLGCVVQPGAAPDPESVVGVAAVEVTPGYPIRLNGFGGRRAESEGVRQRIWAKALAIGSDTDGAAVVIAVDTLAVPDRLVEQLAARLQEKAGVARERLAVTATHTHTGPMIRDVSPTIFGMPIPPEHQAHIDQYTGEFAAKLEQVALAALADRRPARLEWAIGRVGFAANRRTRGGPVDHDLPVLAVKDADGKLRAIYLSYACHCVTLSDNKISGDWAGYAQSIIEGQHPGCLALVSIGCGADSNPNSGVAGDRADLAEKQGREIADEVNRLLSGPLVPVPAKPAVRFERIDLPLAPLPTRDEWTERAKLESAVGHHARTQLARLDRGEELLTKISYPIQSWTFGDTLAIVFLPGEVVVDYATRLKHELDGRRLWINAYANACPGYVPSERILREGGYEGGGAMIYYDIPGPYAPGLEQPIVDVVVRQLGAVFKPAADASRTQGSLPRSPQQSLAALRARPGMVVDLVAAEPLVTSPVAIDFGPDGRLWVAEMFDYPTGVDGNFTPGGRIKLLRDSDSDGRYDRAAVFLDGIPFPTGATVWRGGVLVCAAPDIIYAEDTDGDDKADVVRKLFSGFFTGNYQARVNSLEYGLDGWVHGSGGLFGGEITSLATGERHWLPGRDFRMNPDTGVIEPAAGSTQQGRVRDDWGNWFGCNNSQLLLHYPLADHYLRRNPHVAQADPAVHVPDYPNSHRLFPISRPVLFALSGPAAHVTAACGLGVYRDELLGREFTGNTFTCEPVNNLVHRLVLQPRGSTFAGRRAADETAFDFLASADNWFRPVQVRTGPDGALWVVDMYRYVIEHPMWIPPETRDQLDVRAGAAMGRIYRVYPRDRKPREPVRLDPLDAPALVAALDSPNGWQRDLAQQLLVWNRHVSAAAPLARLANESRRPEPRLQALCTLDVLGQLESPLVARALGDEHPGVRRHAVRLAEQHVAKSAEVADSLLRLIDDSDPQVRLQLACSLGDWDDPRAGRALARLLIDRPHDAHLTAAVLSSVNRANITSVLGEAFAEDAADRLPAGLVERLIGLAAALGDDLGIRRLIALVAESRNKNGAATTIRLAALAGVLESLERRQRPIAELLDDTARQQMAGMLADARAAIGQPSAPEETRVAAVRLIGHAPTRLDSDVALVGELLVPQNSLAIQAAAVNSLARTAHESVPARLLAGWSSHSPQLRAQILDVLLSRDAWLHSLLEAIERNGLAAAAVDLTRRQRIMQHADAHVRARAEKLFAGTTNADRQRVTKDYLAALGLSGAEVGRAKLDQPDSARGRGVFHKRCSSCHELENIGHSVGPDLRPYSGKPPETLIIALLDPNQAVDARYFSYNAALKDGRVLSGVVSGETATSITLDSGDGNRHVILRLDLDELASTGKSLMPEGFERDISPQDMADLVAYVASLRVPPKSLKGNLPELVRPAADGSLTLVAAKAEIYGGDITFELPFQNIGYWHGPDDYAAWAVETNRTATYDVYLDWACDSGVAGNTFVVEGASPPLRGKVASTGAWDQYRQQKIGTMSLAAGTHRLTLRPDGPVRGALLDLHAMLLVPTGQRPRASAGRANQPATTNSPTRADPIELARQILDDALPQERRQAIINDHPTLAPELVRAMIADLRPGTPEEYRRIPWIWRVAIAAGRRNETDQLRRLLDVSLPKIDEPLRDWQAVVVGGGVINGISQQNVWPRQRLDEIVPGHAELGRRLSEALNQAALMVDNQKVPTGTRYDALRMSAMDGWERRGPQLAAYLRKGVDDELQMGAISGLSDIDSPRVPPLLVHGLEQDQFSAGNRELAISALLRTDARITTLLDAIERGRVKTEHLSKSHVEALRNLDNQSLRGRAAKLLE